VAADSTGKNIQKKERIHKYVAVLSLLDILTCTYADIDECADQNRCSKPGKCRNFQGGFQCFCPFGWHMKHNDMRGCERNLALITGVCRASPKFPKSKQIE
jgi:Calcium-binding EGF domain